MRVFVLRARSAPTESEKMRGAVGQEAHTEILAHTLMNAIFVAQSHRDDVIVYLVLESTKDYSRTIRFAAAEMHNIGGFHEQALLDIVAQALDVSKGMAKESQRHVDSGVTVRTIGFEKIVKEVAQRYPVFILDKKGTSIRNQAFDTDACFLLTDHIPMPKNILKSFKRIGVKSISLGPKMLFASQCVVLIHNELDLRS